tara:strand:+ start:4317 stop:4658 length:342 start_codon:yes stop_codon:yes gene_type:complete
MKLVYNITHKDYTFVESEKSDFYGVKLNGEFDGVILIYGKVGIKESKELDIATLSFTYNIKDPKSHDHDELCADEYFNNYIGAVLEHIINETMDDKLAGDIIGHNEPDTDTYA